jgi:3-hydroxybutyryl-CoA dehydrogenase
MSRLTCQIGFDRLSLVTRELTRKTVVVMGTGVMAPGVAAACAVSGAAVRIVGRDRSRAEEAARAATALGANGVHAAELEAPAFADADLVIETVIEDAKVKRALLARLESWLAPEAVIATNTSSLPIGGLAEALGRPERFAGLHFMNPAHLTLIVEVIAGPATSESTVAALSDFAGTLGKQPLVVRKDVPGFLWNRLQFALLRECLHLLDEGIADVEAIDAAITDGLAPRWVAAGPLATADLGGIATFALISEGLFPHLATTPDVSRQLAGRAGAGTGFYRWTDQQRSAIAGIRGETISRQRDLAERRRAVRPSPTVAGQD